MATPARVTGLVLTTTSREGVSKAGNPYHRRETGVLVGGVGVTTIASNVTGQPDDFKPSEAEVIDVLVDLDVYAGRLSVNYLGPYDEKRAAAVAEAVTV